MGQTHTISRRWPAWLNAALLLAVSFIGIAGQTVAVPRRHQLAAGIDNASGAMVTTIEQGAPADAGGLMTLDVIVKVDGETVTGVDDLIRLLNAERIGRTVTFDVLRRGLLRQFDLVPAERVSTRPAATAAK